MIFFVKAQFIVFILGATSQYLFEEKTKKEATNKTNNGMTDKAKAKYNKRPAVTLIKIPITIKDIICPITINKDE